MARGRAARLVALLALTTARCVPTADLELPAAPAGTRTTILAFLDPVSGNALSAHVLSGDTRLAWSLPREDDLALYYYLEMPADLGLKRGELPLPQPGGTFLVLPQPAARWTGTLSVGEPATWRAKTPEELPPLRIAATGSEDCARQRGCFVADVCTTPCPEPPAVDAPIEPAPPTLPVETSCPAGWHLRALDELEASACEPDALLATCPDGQAVFLGAPGCVQVGSPCPSGSFLDPPPLGRTLRYVAPGAAPEGDGSLARPFATIARALADVAPGTTLLLGAGTFDEPVALVGLDDVELRGACTTGTVIGGASIPAGTAVIVAARSDRILVANLRVTPPPGAAAIATATGTVTLEDLWVEGGRAGVVSGPGAVTTLSRAVVQGLDAAQGSALFAAESSELRASDVTVEGGAWGVLAAGRTREGGGVGRGGHIEVTRAVLRAPTSTALLATGDGSSITASEVLVERAGLFGARAIAGAHLHLDRAVIRDGGPGITNADEGGGVVVSLSSGAVVERSILEHNADRNLRVEPTSSATVTRSLILRGPGVAGAESVRVAGGRLRLVESVISGFVGPAVGVPQGTLSIADLGILGCADVTECEGTSEGRGLVVFGGALDVVRLRVRDVPFRAIDCGSTRGVLLEDIDIRGPHDFRELERQDSAVHLNNAGKSVLHRLHVEGVSTGGVHASFPDTELEASDLYFAANGGAGVIAEAGASLFAARIEVHDAVGPGVAIVGSIVPPYAEARLTDVRVDGVREVGYPPAAGIATVLDASVEVTRFHVSHTDARGVFVGQDGVLLRDGVIESSPVGILVLGDTEVIPLLRRVRIAADVEVPFLRME